MESYHNFNDAGKHAEIAGFDTPCINCEMIKKNVDFHMYKKVHTFCNVCTFIIFVYALFMYALLECTYFFVHALFMYPRKRFEMHALDFTVCNA